MTPEWSFKSGPKIGFADRTFPLRKSVTGRYSAHFLPSQARSGPSTPLDARDRDDNEVVFNAKLVLATTGVHLAQFRHRHRPLAKAVDYAELFIYDEAQQEASVSNVTILGALPRKCLVLRLGDPKQTSATLSACSAS